MQQSQGLVEIPSVDVKRLVHPPLANVTAIIKPQIIITTAYVNKSHIIITVGRNKSPRPAARINRQQYGQVFFFFNGYKLIMYTVSNLFKLSEKLMK